LSIFAEISKVAKELYALINYGEMRKKLAFINDKCYLKLSDLVYKGSVTVREKGKNIKIKTPSCRALRKLNELEGNQNLNQFKSLFLKLFSMLNRVAGRD
jgi:hypothetical protein